ncbi:MAG: cyclase family protein [Rhodothermales bacterium]
MNTPSKPESVLSVTDRGVDLSIPLRFDGPQPNLYGVPAASRSVLVTDGFTGSVAEGGSCNVDALRLIPHCNGTHTECVGHITRERITLTECWQPRLLRAVLISVRASADASVSAAMVAEAAKPWLGGDSKLDDQGLGGDAIPEALIVRALPKGADPFTTYGVSEQKPGNHSTPGAILPPGTTSPSGPPPYFLPEATAWMRANGVRHLLTDLPSLDPLDSAELLAHRAFWGMAPGQSGQPDPRTQTVTEFIHVPGNLPDGPGILELHVAPFDLDAAPSRPVFHPSRTP